jgi:hypothetical protein
MHRDKLKLARRIATAEMARVINVIPAPTWLVAQMDGLRDMSPLALAEVECSFRASEEWRAKHHAD